LKPETPEELRCTATGSTLRDLGSMSGQMLNAAWADGLRRPRPLPEDRAAIDRVRHELREAVRARIGLYLPEKRDPPPCSERGTTAGEQFTAEKMLLESEPGIRLPALLLNSKQANNGGPLFVYLSDEGKPADAARPSLALELARAGHTVFALDVRGAGETDPRDRAKLSPLTRYDAQQFRFDSAAVCAAQLGTTLLAMQTLDVIRAIDWIGARENLAGRPVLLVGEGLGGVWAMMSAAFDPRPAGVACVRTVPSYRLIVDSKYYACRDYFWVPRALASFALPEGLGRIAPRPVAWIEPVDAMLEPLEPNRCPACWDWPKAVYARLAVPSRLQVARTPGATAAEAAGEVVKSLVAPSP